jgi:hypothetical protein
MKKNEVIMSHVYEVKLVKNGQAITVDIPAGSQSEAKKVAVGMYPDRKVHGVPKKKS